MVTRSTCRSCPSWQQLMAEQAINHKDFKVQPLMAGRHSSASSITEVPPESGYIWTLTFSKPLTCSPQWKAWYFYSVSAYR